jgi:predicted O-methyltransferase YrrM
MRKHRIKGVEFIGGKNGYRNVEVIVNRIYHTWYGLDGDGLSIPGKYAAAPWDKLFLKHCRETLQPKSYRAVTPDGLLGLFDMIQYIESVSDKPLGEMMAVEIGTYQGAAADCFASAFKLLCTIDPWIRKGREMIDVKAVWEEAMAEHKNVFHYQETGNEAAGYFPYSFFDFIYIDACHDYDSVKNDIKVWLPKLKDTGFLCGHDYPGRGEGVKRAVDERFREPDMVFPDSSWVIQFKKGVRA